MQTHGSVGMMDIDGSNDIEGLYEGIILDEGLTDGWTLILG